MYDTLNHHTNIDKVHTVHMVTYDKVHMFDWAQPEMHSSAENC